MNGKSAKPPKEELTDKPIKPEVAKAKAARVAAKAASEKGKTVLIINGDNAVHLEAGESVLTLFSAFQSMGDEVRIEKAEDTSDSTWSDYDIVVWSCGDDYSAMHDKSEQMLIDYAAAGGRLILEGGNIAAWNKQEGTTTVDHKFRDEVLHATTDWVYHDVDNLKLKNKHPVATTPNVLPATIGFTPGEPGDESGDANAVRILPEATGVYNWSYVAYNGKRVTDDIESNSYGLIASEVTNGGRILFYAFEITDIDDPDIMQKLIQNSENWLMEEK